MTTPVKTTGVTSTSFRVWLATFLPGLAAALQAILTDGTPTHQAVFGLGGGAVALFSTLGKLLHDQGLNKASLLAGANDITAALPELRLNLSKSVSFIENDVPTLTTVISDLQGKVKALEGTATGADLVAIEGVVRKVLAELLKPPA